LNSSNNGKSNKSSRTQDNESEEVSSIVWDKEGVVQAEIIWGLGIGCLLDVFVQNT